MKINLGHAFVSILNLPSDCISKALICKSCTLFTLGTTRGEYRAATRWTRWTRCVLARTELMDMSCCRHFGVPTADDPHLRAPS
jgi:hypothetical protein